MTTPDAGDAGDAPPLDQLADDQDQLGWDRRVHGLMADHAAADDAVATVDADEYLAQLERDQGAGAAGGGA